jgi:hypothetical protein
MQLWQYRLLVTARLLYSFGCFLRPSSGVLKTVVAAAGHAVNYKATYKQVLCVIQSTGMY